ncbi:MAG: hydrogenase iron-sulfur subunit [Thermoplasmata archaeon]|nr:MAG: hydrogenase iron-sulfur subunit [Thermoplasmata archaeon]
MSAKTKSPEPKSGGTTKSDFEPSILVFSCNWCSYTSADLAGINRIPYPDNVKIIRFMCSGRIEPDFIFRAFECGADGVIVSGCKLGECHYKTGNEKASVRVEMSHKLMERLGFEPERLQTTWMTAAEARKFAQVMNDFYKQILELGPNPLKQTGGA